MRPSCHAFFVRISGSFDVTLNDAMTMLFSSMRKRSTSDWNSFVADSFASASRCPEEICGSFSGLRILESSQIVLEKSWDSSDSSLRGLLYRLRYLLHRLGLHLRHILSCRAS